VVAGVGPATAQEERGWTLAEESIDDVSTGRDASLWKIGLAVGYAFGR